MHGMNTITHADLKITIYLKTTKLPKTGNLSMCTSLTYCSPQLAKKIISLCLSFFYNLYLILSFISERQYHHKQII